MRTSSKGIELITRFEGLKLNAYLCPANVWTIGYGATFYADGSKVKQGDTLIRKEQADSLLRAVLVDFEIGVTKATQGVSINQNQFDALVSLAYNIGNGALLKSTLIKVVKVNVNHPQIATEFARWNKAGGKELKGLTIRRKAESDLYFS
jgi:lysozyme